jgi:hypothetical protein
MLLTLSVLRGFRMFWWTRDAILYPLPFHALHAERSICYFKYLADIDLKLNSVAFSPQANYTDRATAGCRLS